MKSVTIALSLALACTSQSPGHNPPGWRGEADLLIARATHGTCVDASGNIFVVGGYGTPAPNSTPTNSVEMLAYDSITGAYAGEWTEIEAMTTRRAGPAVVCANGYLYAIGGGQDSSSLSSVERLDLMDPGAVWELLPSSQHLNTARDVAGAAVDLFGRIYVIGGHTAGGVSNTVERYDPSRPEQGWAFIDSLDHARTTSGVVTDAEGRIWAIGGQGPGGAHMASVEIYDPCQPQLGWQDGPSIEGPNSNNDRAALGADGNIYVAGGWLPGVTDRAWRYSTRNREWQEISPLLVARSRPAMVLGKNGRIFAIGGDTAGGHFMNVESMDTAPCYADCNDDRELDIFDFICFQNSFFSGCPCP